jgi:hypothetical protein
MTSSRVTNLALDSAAAVHASCCTVCVRVCVRERESVCERLTVCVRESDRVCERQRVAARPQDCRWCHAGPFEGFSMQLGGLIKFTMP